MPSIDLLFKVHFTAAPSAGGVTRQLMENSLSHTGTDGEMDTRKKKEKKKRIFLTSVEFFRRGLRAGLC